MPPYPDLQGLPPSHTRPPRSTADHRDAASSAIFARIHAAGNRRRPVKVAAVALANKIARMAWAMMVRGERFNEPKLLPAA